MQVKIVSKRMFLFVIFAGSTFFPAFFFGVPKIKTSITSTQAPFIESTTPLLKQAQTSVGLPVRLKIPSIGVDSIVEHVGLTSDGAMDVPKNPTDVAWYNLGSRPGERGSSVIAGHYDTKKGKPAVFSKLHTLRKGDKIYVEGEDGAITTFVVRESKKYDRNANASDVFGSNNEGAYLNLVTCEGVWNKASKSYSQRLVIFADKE